MKRNTFKNPLDDYLSFAPSSRLIDINAQRLGEAIVALYSLRSPLCRLFTYSSSFHPLLECELSVVIDRPDLTVQDALLLLLHQEKDSLEHFAQGESTGRREIVLSGWEGKYVVAGNVVKKIVLPYYVEEEIRLPAYSYSLSHQILVQDNIYVIILMQVGV